MRPSRARFIAVGVAAPALMPRCVRAQTGSLRVLTVASDPGALPFYAQANGFFRRAGLDVSVSTLGNGAAILAAVAGNAVEIGNANAGSAAAAFLGGVDLKIIADGGLYDARKPTTLLCVMPASPVHGPKDMVGKKLAVNGLRLIADAAVQEWMVRGGCDPNSVGFIEVSFSAMRPLLEAGRVDAAFIGEPVLSTVRSGLRVVAAPNDTIAPRFSYASYVAKNEWLTANRELARRFAAVIGQTAVWANANPDVASDILAGVMKLPRERIAAMTRVSYATSVEIGLLQPSIDIMAKYGYLARRVDVRDLL